MRISIAARSFSLTEALRNAIGREAWALDRRLNGRAGTVSVRLYDVNGNRGGSDKACSVQLRLHGDSAAMVATDIDADMYRAIAGAFVKVERAARSSLARSRTVRRRSGSRLASISDQAPA